MKMSLGRGMALAAVPLLLLAAGAGSASAQPGSGSPPPPKGLEAQSASFVSAQIGFALGARNCSRTDVKPACPAALDETVNGGKTWTKKLGVPKVALVQPYSAPPRNTVSTVRFENANDGWLFNPGLWATTNGGKTWKSVNLGGMVTNVAAADGEVFAVVRPWTGDAPGARLWQSAVGSGKWTKVAKVQPQVTLTVFGHSAWTGLSPDLWTTTNSGKTWAKLSFSCPLTHPDSSEVAAASAQDVSIVCVNPGFPQPGSSQKLVYESTNGGRKFALTPQQPTDPGEVYLLAMPVGKPKVITVAAASGASYFYNTINGGKTWGRQTFFDGGTGFLDLAYASSTTGYVIRFSGTPVIAYSLGLWKTTGGGTWKHVSIP